MKKHLILFLSVLLLITLILVSCGDTPAGTPDTPGADTGTGSGGDSGKNPTETPDDTTGKTDPDAPAPKEITGVTLSDRTVPYNRAEQSLTVAGELPEGVSCTYAYNGNAATGATLPGTYTVTATLSGEGYATKTLTATLTIEPLTITGVTLSNDTVAYDALPHSLRVTGNVPSDVTCSYTYNGEAAEEVTDPGTYTVVATLSGVGYTTLTLRAELKITAKLDKLYTYSFGGKVYFQNPLHDNLLYVWDGTKLSKVQGNETPQFFTADSRNLYFVSKGFLRSSVKSIAADGTVSLFLSDGGEYLTTDGTYLYFAKNSVVNTGNANGIYRIRINHGADDAPEKLTDGKASYLTVVGSYLYYAAGSDKGLLTRIPTAGGTPETLTEEKVSNIVAKGNVLYCNVHTLTGNAIHRYSIDAKTLTKMTTDSGDHLTIVGQYLYYINSDLLTGKAFGDGIYRVALDAAGSLPGEKVVSADVSSLTSDGANLYYYLVNTKHLHRYQVTDGTVTDLMASFTPVDDTTAGAHSYTYVKEYGGEIYFLNARDGGSIWKYNPVTRAAYKVVSDSCSAFYFHGDYLWYSTYIATNYAFWRVPLTGGEAEKISSSRCDEVLFDGEYLYFVDNGNTFNTLRRLKPDSTAKNKEEETLYGSLASSVHCVSLVLHDGKVFFCTKPKTSLAGKLMYYDIATGKTNEVTGTSAICFTADDTALYYYNAKEGTLCAYDFATGTVKTLVTRVEIQSLSVHGGIVYYADTTSGAEGVWSVRTDGTGKTRLATGTFAGVSATSVGVLYYEMSYTLEADFPKTEGTGHLYLLKPGATTPTKIV